MRLSSILPLLALVVPVDATAATRYTNQHFSAEVVNVRRLSSGKVIVTVTFKASLGSGSYLNIYANSADCRTSATWIDGEGNEYGTNRCMPIANGWTYEQSMKLGGSDQSSFVYEFSTPRTPNGQNIENANLIIPIKYTIGAGYSFSPTSDSSIVLSFFDFNIR
jgi:hypothetical protein